MSLRKVGEQRDAGEGHRGLPFRRDARTSGWGVLDDRLVGRITISGRLWLTGGA